MEKTSDIISDKRCAEVHANANFGDRTPRQVLNGAVLTYALGFTSGSTALAILLEHGLIKKSTGYTANLTLKGKRYARAMVGSSFNQISVLVGA